MPSSRFLLLTLIAIGLPLSAIASSGDTKPAGKAIDFGNVTEEAVRNFYELSKQLHEKPYAEYAAFMSAHTSEMAQITLNMTNHMPGGKEQKQTIIMDKDKFIASLPESYRFSRGAKVEHKIISLDVAPDGKSANVKDVTFISNSIRTDTARGPLRIDVQTQSSCEDTVIGEGADMLKITKSTCTAESFFFLPKPKTAQPQPGQPE